VVKSVSGNRKRKVTIYILTAGPGTLDEDQHGRSKGRVRN